MVLSRGVGGEREWSREGVMKRGVGDRDSEKVRQ